MSKKTDLPYQLKEDYPNGDIILMEDYQKNFKAETRWRDTKKFLRKESRRAWVRCIRATTIPRRIDTCVDLRVSMTYTTAMIVENRR